MTAALRVLRGLRNGVVYGARVRFPHALVMTLLFRSGSAADKARAVLRATFQHAANLGTYVALYKATLYSLRRMGLRGSTAVGIAGAVGGGLVFGDRNPVNAQINMYVMARVLFGCVNVAMATGTLPPVRGGYRIYAAVCWCLVMVLFERNPSSLQPSLASSMEYLYHDSDRLPRGAPSAPQWWIHGSGQ